MPEVDLQGQIFANLEFGDEFEKRREIFNFLSTKYASQTGCADLAMDDLKVLGAICEMANDVRLAGNPKMTCEFADGFHGLAFAVQNRKLDRKKYSEMYFNRFLAAWNEFLRAENVEKIAQWAAK